MSDYPRRRRLEPQPPKRGGIPIIPLMVLVILGGLLLGGLLTKIFGAGGSVAVPTARPSFTPLPGSSATYAPTESPTPRPTRTAHPSPAVSASAHASASPIPSPSPTSKALAAAPPTPHGTPPVVILTPTPAAAHATTASPESTVAPTVAPTPVPEVTSAATATPVLITGENSTDHAVAIVRAYVASLARGDSATAAGYLASGLPTETFINPGVTVNMSDARAARNDDGSVSVTAQIVTSKGTYLTFFTLRMGPYGMQITEHSATHI